MRKSPTRAMRGKGDKKPPADLRWADDSQPSAEEKGKPVHAIIPSDEKEAFDEWWQRRGFRHMKDAIRYALWNVVAHDLDPRADS